MEYNLLSGALWTVNLTEGNKNVPFNELNNIAKYSETPITELNETDIMVLDFDLGMRVNTDRIEYKFETLDASSSAVASGINFSYKNESFETEYISLSTYASQEDPNIYGATITGSIWGPRYFRISHS